MTWINYTLSTPQKTVFRKIKGVRTPIIINAEKRRCEICESDFWAFPEHHGKWCPACLFYFKTY